MARSKIDDGVCASKSSIPSSFRHTAVLVRDTAWVHLLNDCFDFSRDRSF